MFRICIDDLKFRALYVYIDKHKVNFISNNNVTMENVGNFYLIECAVL